MAYTPFKIRKADLPLATLATAATVEPPRAQSVANVASVARGVWENEVSINRTVATVASVARHIPKTENRPLPAPEPITRPQVAEAETPATAVARLLDEMAAENERRRDWFRASPYEPDGSLVIRSALSGEEITINLPYRGTRH